MPMEITTKGMTELTKMIESMNGKAREVAAGSLYRGAGIVADALAGADEGISTEPFRGKRKYGTRLPSPEEKAALQGKTGVGRFRDDGSGVNTVVGFSKNAGYTMLGKRKTPVIEIARSINSGTSFMSKQPVYRKAVSGSRKSAEDAIVKKAEEMLNDIINNKGA